MSIYPVNIQEWYYKPDRPYYSERKALERLLPEVKCVKCGKPVTKETGYIMHSATFGGPQEAWCSKRCLHGS